jgi:hypothetical protein
MKNALLYALPIMLIAFLLGHEVAGGKYQIEAVGDSGAFLQLNTSTGATRFCKLRLVSKTDRKTDQEDVPRVTICGTWSG